MNPDKKLIQAVAKLDLSEYVIIKDDDDNIIGFVAGKNQQMLYDLETTVSGNYSGTPAKYIDDEHSLDYSLEGQYTVSITIQKKLHADKSDKYWYEVNYPDAFPHNLIVALYNEMDVMPSE